MKRKLISLFSTVIFITVSCGDKGDDTARTIEQLKQVVYEKEAPKTIASKKNRKCGA